MPPYILMNYVDDYRSVSNLSHELGHSLYSTYAAEQASGYNGNPSAFTQEVTSTLNELLLSDYMIQNAKTEEERQYYAAQQIDLLYSAFFRQAQYALFQQSAVAEVEAGGTLTADKLDELWLASVRNIYGDTLNLPEDYANGWARIPHFYQGFYVYRYAVGINAACNIADRIQSGEPGAVEDYIAFLKAGDTGNAVELLQIAGVDVSNGAYVEAFITRFDRLVAQLK